MNIEENFVYTLKNILKNNFNVEGVGSSEEMMITLDEKLDEIDIRMISFNHGVYLMYIKGFHNDYTYFNIDEFDDVLNEYKSKIKQMYGEEESKRRIGLAQQEQT